MKNSRIGMAGQSDLQRVAFSPGEFAALFGKQQTWGYRQIYAGKVKAITEYGRIQIPAAEVERILATADRYNGMQRKPAKSKKELEGLKPELKSAWQIFLRSRKSSGVAPDKGNVPIIPARVAGGNADTRKAALARLVGRKDAPGERKR